jgi:hypothetical protein
MDSLGLSSIQASWIRKSLTNKSSFLSHTHQENYLYDFASQVVSLLRGLHCGLLGLGLIILIHIWPKVGQSTF